jgi:hypothetical protein
VFDKDNTLTEPFSLEVDPRLRGSLGACQAAFGASRLVLYSNSAGLEQYDPEGRRNLSPRGYVGPGEAMAVEGAAGEESGVTGGAARGTTNASGQTQPKPPHLLLPARPITRLLAGEEAAALEAALGVHVLRHSEKKPSGGSGELERHFGCPASELVMVGDR